MLSNTTPSAPRRSDRARRRQLAEGLRRRYSLSFKLQVVKETLAPGASVSVVAQRHKINTNAVFRWRKLFREGRLGDSSGPDGNKLLPTFVPVRVVPDVPALPAPQTSRPAAARKEKAPPKPSGVMTITLPGGLGLRVDAGIDDATLRRVLRAVRDLA